MLQYFHPLSSKYEQTKVEQKKKKNSQSKMLMLYFLALHAVYNASN